MFFKRQQKYSIRKYKVGVFSVLLGSLLVGIPESFVHSEEQAASVLTTEKADALTADGEDIFRESAVLEVLKVESGKEKAEGTFELVAPNRTIPVVDVNQLKESEKDRVKNLILKSNKSLSEQDIRVTDTGDVYITVGEKEYYLPALTVIEQAEDLIEGSGFRIGETGSFNQAFGYHNNKSEVPGIVQLESKKVSYSSNGDAIITYTVIYNSKRGTDARGKFYVATADYASLGRVTANEISGGLIEQPFVNPAPNENINKTVYNKMNSAENAYYKGLTKINTADPAHLNYIRERTNPTGKAYRATIQVTVSKSAYERNGNKVYTAFGVTTLTSGPASSNRVRFEETKLNFNANNQPSVSNGRTLPKDYTLQGTDQDPNRPNVALWYLPNRPKDPGFVYSSELNALIYRYAIGENSNVPINSNDLLNLLTAKPNAFNKNSTDAEINRYFLGKDKVQAEGGNPKITPPRIGRITLHKNDNTYYYEGIDPKTRQKFSIRTKVLDLVQPVSGKLWGNQTIDLTGSQEGADGVEDKTKYNRVDHDFTISADKNNGKGSASWTLPGMIRGAEGSNDIATNIMDGDGRGKAISKLQLYLRNKPIGFLGINPDTETDNLNVFVVPVDVTKPRVQKETAQAITVPKSFADFDTLTSFVEANKSKIIGKDNFSTNASLTKKLKFYNEQDQEIDAEDLVPSMRYKMKAVVIDEAGLVSDPLEVGNFIFKPIDAENVPKKVVSDTKVPAGTKVLKANQDGATFRTPKNINGMSVDSDGNLQGTPNVTFAEGEYSKEITIPVNVERNGESKLVNAVVTVNKKVSVTPISLKIPNGVKILENTKAVEANQPGVFYIPLNDGDGFRLNDKGMLEGTPNVTFESGKDTKDFEIVATGNKGEHGAAGVRIPVTVYRPLEVTSTSATVINSVETSSNTVISHNQVSGATITAPTVNGLTVNEQGKLVGTPDVPFTEDELEKNITIPVTVTKGNQSKITNVTVTVKKKFKLTALPHEVEEGVGVTGRPIVVDANTTPQGHNLGLTLEGGEVDGLGINRYGQLYGTPTTTFNNNEDNKTVTLRVSGSKYGHGSDRIDVPIVVNKSLAGTPHEVSVENGKTKKAKVLTVNQQGATLTPVETEGLTITADGSLSGTANTTFAENEDHKVVNIPVTISKSGRKNKDVIVPITVYKPLVGTPNETSLENGIAANTITHPVLNVNQQGFSVTSNTVSGLSIDEHGNLTGTPNVRFKANEDSKVVTLKATVSKSERDNKIVNVPVTVYKSLDATKATKEATNGLPLSKTKVLTPNQNDVEIVPSSANGLTVDEQGNVSGTPKVTFPDGQNSVTVEIPVTLRKANRADKTVVVSVRVNKPKDTTAPDAPVIDTDLTDKAGTKDPVVVTGAEPGSTVTLKDKDGNPIGSGTADDNGRVEIT
ncbi:YSIRK-type signal peptide-containing protein, partial [Carnobacteriaceae bacterium zg-ZUI78]|nr:YSIRK-type signal peptide-containing protein [Carnobacteriaceae bacterium zg-ZUI78]